MIATIILAGCEKPEEWGPTYPPEFFAHWSDRQKERFPELQTIFGPSCVWRMVEAEDCFRMTKPKRWSGLWRTDFEESRFCPDNPSFRPAEICDDFHFRREAWLTGNLSLPGKGDEPLTNGKLFRIEFIGRRTENPGNFGHMGMYDYEMVVDRMISIKEVPEAAQK